MRVRTGDEDMRTAVLAVIDEEIGVGTVGNCVLARVCVRCPLRHLSSKPLASTPPEKMKILFFFSLFRFLSGPWVFQINSTFALVFFLFGQFAS